MHPSLPLIDCRMLKGTMAFLAVLTALAVLRQVEYDIYTARLSDAVTLADEHERLRALFQQRVSATAISM